MNKFFCVFLGIMLGASIAVWMMKERANWLASLEFELNPPPVPASILTRIRGAESRSYESRLRVRRLIEEAQDVVVFTSPELAYKLNFSVGRYRIKANSIEAILPWAIERRFIILEETSPTDFAHALAYFSEQPGLNDWQAATYLQWLKEDHPLMANLTWSEIEAEPKLVAKLYSGYMGAGGAWELWRENLVPGPIAKQRLGLN